MEKKQIAYSAIQPTGKFTIGNYYGALHNWEKIQHEYNSLFCIANLHALTVPQKAAELRKHTYEAYALLLAVGIDPEESLLYVQSQVPAHTELCWLLNCSTYMGELSRMTQFKDKSQNQGKNVRVGLFDYPVLMAADILLYQTNVVPVGADQKQHVELCRDIAERFNNTYGQTFTLPEPVFGTTGKRIMSLQNPQKKMSKSDANENSYITLLDDEAAIIRKLKRAVTDSDMQIRYDLENKPGVSNLIEIYSCTNGKSFEEIEKEFEGLGYGDFKLAVGEAIAKDLKPMQEKYKELLKDKAYLDKLMKENAQKAESIARRTLRKVRRKLGILEV